MCFKKIPSPHDRWWGSHYLIYTWPRIFSLPLYSKNTTITYQYWYHTSPKPYLVSISSQALFGHPSPKSLKFIRNIWGFSIPYSLRVGAPTTFCNLALPSTFISQLTLPNHYQLWYHGDLIACTCFCPHIPLDLHTHSFTIPCYQGWQRGGTKTIFFDNIEKKNNS